MTLEERGDGLVAPHDRPVFRDDLRVVAIHRSAGCDVATVERGFERGDCRFRHLFVASARHGSRGIANSAKRMVTTPLTVMFTDAPSAKGIIRATTFPRVMRCNLMFC